MRLPGCLIFLAASLSATFAEDLLDAPENLVYFVPRNAKEGDVIVAEREIRVRNLDESVDVELEGSPSPVALNSTVVDPLQPVRFLLVNRHALDARVKLQALGLISGGLHEVWVTFKRESDSLLPSFVIVSQQLVVEKKFREKETAIIKLTSSLPEGAEVFVVGANADRFDVAHHDENIILTTVPCGSEDKCDVELPFSVLLVARSGDDHVESKLDFVGHEKDDFRFEREVFETNVEEKSANQGKLVKLRVLGNSSEVLFSLHDSSGLFAVHPKEGILTILHPEFVTRQSFGDVVRLKAMASEAGRTAEATVAVHIDERSNVSNAFGFVDEFNEFAASSMSRVVGNVGAVGNRSSLIYAITEGRADLYVVDPNGDLAFIGGPQKESREDFLTVSAREAANGLKVATTKIVVKIDGIGSHAVVVKEPSEGAHVVSLDRGEEVGVVVLSTAFVDADPDARLNFSVVVVEATDVDGVVAAAPEALFDVAPSEQTAHVVLRKSLKAAGQRLAYLKLQVSAVDVAHPKEPKAIVERIVLIEGQSSEEEMRPLKIIEFPNNVSVAERAQKGSYVYQAVVVPSKNTTFTVEPQDLFSIDQEGVITTTSKILADTSQPIQLVVAATDGETTTDEVSSNVTVTRRRRAHFVDSEYTATVPIHAPAGTVITLASAVTAEGDAVTGDFVLLGPQAVGFNVDEQGTIKTAAQLGPQQRRDFDFFVALASDPAVVAPVHVRLDETTATPTFATSETRATLFDDAPPHAFVARVAVVNDVAAKFALHSDDADVLKAFFIDDDGTIRTIARLQGRRGEQRMTISASSMDNSGVTSANQTAIVNVLPADECRPDFIGEENLIFHVRENSPAGATIGKVNAKELDHKCAMRFSLWDPSKKQHVQSNDVLTVDEVTGEIRAYREFDFEKETTFPVVLRLRAGRHYERRLAAELMVLDDDDHPVRFDTRRVAVEVPENATTSSVVTRVRAIDADIAQPVFYHLASTSPPQFSLHSTTGVVSLEQPLDRELNSRFEIEIGASNEPDTPQEAWPTSMTLVVLVRDVNDNGPMFTSERYEAVIDKDSVVGTAVDVVHAVDADDDDKMTKLGYSVAGTSFEYRGMSRRVDAIFDVDAATGVVRILQPLRPYVGGVFHVSLQAAHPSEPSAVAKVGLKVYVHEASDVLSVELPYKPTQVTPQIVDDVVEQLSSATSLAALVKEVDYQVSHGIASPNSVDLRVVFFNKTASEILSAEKTLAILEKFSAGLRALPPIRRVQEFSEKSDDEDVPSELLLIGLVFVLALVVVCVLLALLMCYYRARYFAEKKRIEDDKAIQNAISIGARRSPPLVSFKHFPSPAPELHRPLPFGDKHVYRSPTVDGNVGSYAVQQASITVGAGDK